jgi:hypothetical protein
MSTFWRRTLMISMMSVAAALCGLAIYAYRVFTNVPSLPNPATHTETSNDLPWRFHKVLTKPEKQHVLDGQFTVVASTQTMPASLKHAFAVITGQQQFALADPGQKYQVTDVVYEPGLPFRRLVFAGLSGDKWFIHYEHGGIGHGYAVVVLAVQPEGRVQFLWGGVGSHRAKDLDDLRKSIAGNQFCDDGGYYW